MNRLLRIAILTFTAAMVLVIASPQLQAQSKWKNHSPKATSGPKIQLNNQSLPGTLYKSYFTQNDDAEMNSTADQDLPLDSPTTVVCPSSRGCTLEVEQFVSVGGVDSTGNWCGPFVWVDGNENDAPPAGETPTDEGFISASGIWTTNLAPGKHTVQSSVYSYYGLNVYGYHITYRVYVSGTPVIF